MRALEVTLALLPLTARLALGADAGSPAPETAPYIGTVGGDSLNEVPPIDSGSPADALPSAPEAPATAPTSEPEPAPTTAPEVVAAPAPAPAPEPEPAPPAATASTASRSSDFDPRVPRYQRLRPQWGLEITASIKALGGASSTIPGLDTSSASAQATSFQFEWQPRFIQKVGVLSIGPSVNFYIAPSAAAGLTGLWSVGGQIRYQARFLREQPLVPYAGFAMENVFYKLTAGPSGSLMNKGVFFGGALLLNFFEPSASAEFYINTGITRSYLVAELRQNGATDGTVTLAGSSLFFGLRFEF